MKKNYGVIAAAVLILFSVYIYSSSFSITSTANAALGPAFMPQTVAAILFVLGCLNLMIEIRERQRISGSEAADGKEVAGATVGAGGKKDGKDFIVRNIDYISGVVLLVYVFSIKPLGFLISSCLYMFVHMILLTVNTKRNYITIILLAVIAPSVVYFGFVKIFYLMLPPGLLG